jgi:saccharopine dehydrogenase (NADP+, L-glutamate forming)
MKRMGSFSSEKAVIVGGNLLDTLCAQLQKLMSYALGEQDLVMLQHRFVVKWPDHTTVRYIYPSNVILADNRGQEIFTSTLKLLGDPSGFSAMARSVGVTCGIATQLLLDGHPALCKPGVLAPYMK